MSVLHLQHAGSLECFRVVLCITTWKHKHSGLTTTWVKNNRWFIFCVHFNGAPCSPIDLFGLYVLFSHFRPRDAIRGNSFFQMSSYALANVRITNDKNKKKIPMRDNRRIVTIELFPGVLGNTWTEAFILREQGILPNYFQRTRELLIRLLRPKEH